MATSRELVEAYRGVSADIASMAADDMAAFIETLDLTDVAKAREALIVFTDSLVKTYGRAEAMTAAKFYDDLRGISDGATGRFRATLADGATRDQIVGTVRWAVGQDNPGLALAGSVQRLLAQTGRNTIAGNASRDPSHPTWARVPSGPHVCDFCRMLATRGAAYGSKESAGGDGNRYHDRCHCVPTPMWGGDKFPGGHDPVSYGDPVPQPRGVVRLDNVPDAVQWATTNMTDPKSFADPIRREIEYYTGAGANSVNHAIRTNTFTGSKGLANKATVKALDSAMKKSVLTDDVIVTRMTDGIPFKKFIPKGGDVDDLSVLAGQVLKDKGYLSTALGTKPAHGFADSFVRMEITVPAGSKALWVQPVSVLKAEREVILNRGTNLVIDSATYNSRTRQWLLKATAVPK